MSHAAASPAPAAPKPKKKTSKLAMAGWLVLLGLALLVALPYGISRLPVVGHQQERMLADANDDHFRRAQKVLGDKKLPPSERARQVHSSEIVREYDRNNAVNMPKKCPDQHENNHVDWMGMDLRACQKGATFPVFLPDKKKFVESVYAVKLMNFAPDGEKEFSVSRPELKVLTDNDGFSLVRNYPPSKEMLEKYETFYFVVMRGEVAFEFKGKGAYLEVRLVTEATP